MHKPDHSGADMFRVDEEVGVAKLRKTYDGYANSVLGIYLEELPREKRKQRRFKVIKEDMPTVEEYQRMKANRYRTNVEAIIDEAYSEVECLAEEMRDRYDNMPENLQGGDVGCRVEEAADGLEGIDRVDYPQDLDEIDIVFLPSLKLNSRSDRACEAGSQLREAADGVRQWMDDEDQADISDDKKSIFEDFAQELENHADELESIEFPGMYG